MLREKKPSESMDSWNIVPQIDLECVVTWMSRRSEKEKNKMFRTQAHWQWHYHRAESDAAAWGWGHLACRWCGWVGSSLWSRRRLQADGEIKTSRCVAQVPWQKAAGRDHWAGCGPHVRIGHSTRKAGDKDGSKILQSFSITATPEDAKKIPRKEYHLRGSRLLHRGIPMPGVTRDGKRC